MVIITDKLRANTYNELAKKTTDLVNSLCTGILEHILKALSSGKDYTFTEPQLKSADQKDQIVYKSSTPNTATTRTLTKTTKLPPRIPSMVNAMIQSLNDSQT